MRVRSLCALLLLTLIALPAWSAAPSASPVPQITLADIMAPAPTEAAAFPDIFQALACIPCSSTSYCQNLCECSVAVCTFNSFCQRNICNCTACP